MGHICIDGLNLGLPYGSGIATYARTLVGTIKQLGHETSVLYGRNVPSDRRPGAREAVFFAANEGITPRSRLRRGFRSLRSALSGTVSASEIPRTGLVVRDERLDVGDTLWNVRRLFDAAYVRFRLTGQMMTVRNPGGVDICHWTCPVPISMAGAKNFYTFHDLIPLRYPHLVLEDPSYFYGVAHAVIEKADRIVTISEHSRSEVVELLSVKPEKVVNTWQAVDIPGPSVDGAGALEVYGLEAGGFYLSVSAIEPKKNIGRLIEAYLASGSTRQLVIAGHYSWLPHADVRMLTNMGLWDLTNERPQSGGRIRFLGHVPRAHLDRLLRSARAVLFPSITEGFGLPIVEAMGRGRPVLTSRGGATGETAGDAAMLVDATSSGSIAQGIRELDGNDALVARLAEAGPARAAQFSPEAYRQRLTAIYAGI